MSIVAAVRDIKARFLEREDGKVSYSLYKKDEAGNPVVWRNIGDKRAIEKTSQALREGQPKLLKKLVDVAVHNHMIGENQTLGIRHPSQSFPPGKQHEGCTPASLAGAFNDLSHKPSSTDGGVGAKRTYDSKTVLPKEHTYALLVRMMKLVNTWAKEEQMNGNNIRHWDIMSIQKMARVATLVPTTLDELADCEPPENTHNMYGERLINNINAYIVQEKLERYIENRPNRLLKT
jgi:hypothetical protein